MIPLRDYTKQELEYTRNGEGRWEVAGYCPGPVLFMRNLETGDEINFGVGGLAMKEFDPILHEGMGASKATTLRLG